MNAILSSPQARKALSIGFNNHWRFRVVTENSYADEWRTENLPEAPETALERIQALKSHGISIKGFVVAHEAPRLLPAPKAEEAKRPEAVAANYFPLGEIIFYLFYLLSQMLIQVILLDPALIVVLEDGTWLEVMTWYE